MPAMGGVSTMNVWMERWPGGLTRTGGTSACKLGKGGVAVKLARAALFIGDIIKTEGPIFVAVRVGWRCALTHHCLEMGFGQNVCTRGVDRHVKFGLLHPSLAEMAVKVHLRRAEHLCGNGGDLDGALWTCFIG